MAIPGDIEGAEDAREQIALAVSNLPESACR